MKYKLVGNAVPPKLSYAFAKAMAIKENMEYISNYTLLKQLFPSFYLLYTIYFSLSMYLENIS